MAPDGWFGSDVARMLIADTDQVLPKLLSDSGALLGHGGLLVDGDNDCLHGLHDVDTTKNRKYIEIHNSK